MNCCTCMVVNGWLVKCLVIQMAWIPVGKNHHASLGTIIIISCEVTLLPSDVVFFWIIFMASYQLSFLGELNEYSHWRNTTQSQMKKFEDFILRANKYPSLSIFLEYSNQTTDKKMLLIEVLKLHVCKQIYRTV